jgi:hypothetical protein
MRSVMKNNHGVSLIAAVFIIVILAFMGGMLVSLINTGSFSSTNDLQSVQALYVAEGGAEYARLQFTGGTPCNSLGYNNISLGQGAVTSAFTTTGMRYNPAAPLNLGANITAAATVIPVSGNPIAAGYAPQGRIMIESEAIWYGGTLGNSFINADRGVGGTTNVAHNAAPVVQVLQDQCRIQSTGTVRSAARKVAVDLPGTGASANSVTASLSGTPTNIGTSMTDLGTMPTMLNAGNNLIVAVVVLQNTTGTVANINAGNLQLRSGATTLASNQSLIRVVGLSNNPHTTYNETNNFPQQTYFFLYRDAGALGSPTYSVAAQATAGNLISARVQMVAFNGVPNSYYSSDGIAALTNAANGAVLSTHATGLPAGDNVILAAVQFDNPTAANSSVVNNGLRLRKGAGNGTVLDQNQVSTIDFEASGNAKRGGGYLLIARDTTAAANQTYTVTGRTNPTGVNGSVRMLVLQGLPFANVATAVVNLPATVTTLATLNTAFPSGGINVVISGTQTFNTSYDNYNILTDQLVSATKTSSNILPIYLDGAVQDDDYGTGLILVDNNNASANPTYVWQARADTANMIQASTDIVAIRITNSGATAQLYGWQGNLP